VSRVHDGCEVLCIGETMVMVTPAEPGRLDARTPMILSPGGAESNVAVHLASLGHRVAWAGQVGRDPFGDLILEELQARRVETSLTVRVSEAPTGVFFKDPSADKTSVYYYRAGSAASRMSRAMVPAWSAARAEIVHVSGITAALSAQCRDLMRHLIHDRPLTGKISFDVNHRPTLGSDDTPDILLELAQKSDIVFVGRDEAEVLWGTRTASSVRALLDKPTHLIVKDAEVEAVEFVGSDIVKAPSRRVSVVDAVGAGDAFAAGWLSAYLKRLPPERRLASGHDLAARVLTSTTDYANPGTSEGAIPAGGRGGHDHHNKQEDPWTRRTSLPPISP
jgi:2-dehydro-3-deoxygluconokinase